MKDKNGEYIRKIDHITYHMGNLMYLDELNDKDKIQESKSTLLTIKKNTINMAIYGLNKEGNTYKFMSNNFKELALNQKIESGVLADTWREAEIMLQQIDLRPFLNINVDLKESFKSDLFPNETLYINKIKTMWGFGEMKYRLFFKRSKARDFDKNGEADKFEESYSILDIYMIVFGKKYYEAMEELTNIFNIKIDNKEVSFRKRQVDKMKKNSRELNDLKEYPNLLYYINKHLIVLRTLNSKASNYILSIATSYNKEAVFFASTRQFEEQLKPILKKRKDNKRMSYSTISRVFQLYRVLGLIQVVPADKVPQPMLDKAPSLPNEYNDFMYFIVPSYNKTTLAKAERTAKKLIKARFVISQISRAKIEEIMGKDFADNIYSASVERYKRAVERAKNRKIEEADSANQHIIEENDEIEEDTFRYSIEGEELIF